MTSEEKLMMVSEMVLELKDKVSEMELIIKTINKDSTNDNS